MASLARLLPVCLFLLPGLARADVDTRCLAPGADCTLREIATAAGVRIGAAGEPAFLASDPLYGPALAAEMNSLTSENNMKWPAIHPAEEVWNFGPADAWAGFAEDHDMRMRGHTLLWANPVRIPDWVNAAPDAETLERWLDEHVRTVVTRYRDRVDAWDVVNEPLNNFGTTLYDNVFHQLLGPDYIARAFRIAHEADPEATLFLNEVLVERPDNPRFDAFYDLVVDLLAQDVPLHGIGFQGHLVANVIEPTAEEFAEAIRRFTDLGLVVEVTELDVVIANGSPALLERQGAIYEEFARACLENPGCRGITTWGISDAHTWIDGTFGPGRVPLPLDVDYLRKPAYEGLRNALLARLARVPEPRVEMLLALAVLAYLPIRARAWISTRAPKASSVTPTAVQAG